MVHLDTNMPDASQALQMLYMQKVQSQHAVMTAPQVCIDAV